MSAKADRDAEAEGSGAPADMGEMQQAARTDQTANTYPETLARSIRRHKICADFGWYVGVPAFFSCAPAAALAHLEMNSPVTMAAFLGAALYVWGSFHLAKSKGYSGALGLALGILLPVVGVLILDGIRDKFSTQDPEQTTGSRRLRRRIFNTVALVLFFLPLVFIAVSMFVRSNKQRRSDADKAAKGPAK